MTAGTEGDTYTHTEREHVSVDADMCTRDVDAACRVFGALEF